MRKFSYLIVAIAVLVLTVQTACKKDEDNPPEINAGNTIYIVNEGPFQTGSGTISIFDHDSNTVQTNVFESVNGRPLGNIVQSINVFENRAYIVVHKANVVEVVEAKTFESIGTIESVIEPRYFLGITSDKGYITSWDDKVYVVDLNSFEITDEIIVRTGPDKMLRKNDHILVLNKGGLGFDSTISVIDAGTNAIVETIQVGSVPSGIVEDKDGMIWVLCSGKGWNGFPQPGDTKGQLFRIDPDYLQWDRVINFPDSDNHPDQLAINSTGDTLYYIYPDGVYEIGINSTDLSASALIPSSTIFYGLGFDPVENNICVADPLDYTQAGKVYRYTPQGVPIDTISAGVIPNGFYFNE